MLALLDLKDRKECVVDLTATLELLGSCIYFYMLKIEQILLKKRKTSTKRSTRGCAFWLDIE